MITAPGSHIFFTSEQKFQESWQILKLWDILPREISCFVHYFSNYGGKLEPGVQCIKYRPSPIPTGGLEIRILLICRKENLMKETFEKMENLVKSHYTEMEKNVEMKPEMEEDIDLEAEYCPKSDITN